MNFPPALTGARSRLAVHGDVIHFKFMIANGEALIETRRDGRYHTWHLTESGAVLLDASLGSHLKRHGPTSRP